MLDPTDDGVRARWQAMWETSPQHSPFSRLDYLQAVARAAGHRIGIHFSRSAGADRAAAALTWRRRGPYREVLVPPATPFSAVLLDRPLDEAEVHARRTPLESLLGDLESSYDAVRLHLHPSLGDVRAAQWRGWNAEPLYTYRIGQADPQGWSTSAARNLRTARDEFELVEGEAGLEAAAHLASESYARRDRTPPLPASALLDVARAMADGASGYAARRRASGEAEAGLIVLRDDRTAYYWIAGSRPGDAMTVLLGGILPGLFDDGVETFDFVGANTPTIAEFKRRFGAELMPYFALRRTSRAGLRLLYRFRKMLR